VRRLTQFSTTRIVGGRVGVHDDIDTGRRLLAIGSLHQSPQKASSMQMPTTLKPTLWGAEGRKLGRVAMAPQEVDMRIGLDIANFAKTRAFDRIVLVTGDTDCIPAMKYGRIAGLQVAWLRFPIAKLYLISCGIQTSSVVWHGQPLGCSMSCQAIPRHQVSPCS
jgi:hypothetical protein